jgi:hypothetical protein
MGPCYNFSSARELYLLDVFDVPQVVSHVAGYAGQPFERRRRLPSQNDLDVVKLARATDHGVHDAHVVEPLADDIRDAAPKRDDINVRVPDNLGEVLPQAIVRLVVPQATFLLCPIMEPVSEAPLRRRR